MQPGVVPSPSPPTTPIVQIQQTPPAVVPVAAAQPVVVTQSTTAPEISETDKQLEECRGTLTNKIAALAKFRADCQSRLDANDAKLPGFGPADRVILKHKNDSARKSIEDTLKVQVDVLKSYQVVLAEYADKSRKDPQSTIERLMGYYEKLEKVHANINSILSSLDKDFTPDPH